jgi:O-antigen/teichoic acid export membrane protein
MTGTALGQIIALAFSVIVSRLYSPEDFATLEHFAMLLGILGVVAAGRYEAAIMLPKDHQDAYQLLRLVFRVAFWFSVAIAVLTLVFANPISIALGNPQMPSVLWLTGPVVFLFAVTTGLQYWFGRLKTYRTVATSKTLFSLISEPLKVGFSKLIQGGIGLSAAVSAGHAVSAGYAWWKFKRSNEARTLVFDKKRMREVALEYKDYPRFSAPGTLLNRLSQWSHIALFGALYGEPGLIVIGFMGLARRVVLGPLSMIANSFSQVYFQRITEIDDNELKGYYVRSLRQFLLLGFAMIAVVWLLPDKTMAVIFGQEWYESLEYLRILVFWFAANFTASSLSFIMHRIRRQKQILLLDALHFALILIALLAAWFAGLDAKSAIAVFVAAKVIYFIFNVLITLRFLSALKNE